MKINSMLCGHKKRAFIRVCLLSALIFSAVPSLTKAQEKCDDPLPPLNVLPPVSEVPKEFAMFSGVWKGKWDGLLCSSFVIEVVDEDGNVDGIYSWGRGRDFESGNMRFTSSIEDGKIKFGRRTKFTFWLSPESGWINGERYWNQWTNSVLMEKVKAP